MQDRHEPDIIMDGLTRMKKAWGWLVVIGIISLIGGFLCFANPFGATITADYLAAFFFIIVGIGQLIQAFSMREWGGVIWSAILGVIAVLVGALMIKNPIEGAASLTLLVGVLLLIMGGAKIGYSLSMGSVPGRFWIVISGIFSIVLAILIFADFPWAAVTVLGLFLGVELIFNGVSLLMLGFALRNA
jgi:uncharacterized membrane protein HdeD (DUF308 family)